MQNAMFILINMFINIPQHIAHIFYKKKKNKQKIYTGYNHARTRRTATIAINRRGWHWKYEPQQLGGHATRIEGNLEAT